MCRHITSHTQTIETKITLCDSSHSFAVGQIDARRDYTRLDQTRQDQTRLDQTRLDQTSGNSNVDHHGPYRPLARDVLDSQLGIAMYSTDARSVACYRDNQNS